MALLLLPSWDFKIATYRPCEMVFCISIRKPYIQIQILNAWYAFQV